MLASRRLTEQQAHCVHCPAKVVESTGHRYWKCSRWEPLRDELGPDDFDEADWPRCLTRSGVVPRGCPLSAARTMDIQRPMTRITQAIAVSPAAKQQHELATSRGGVARPGHAYRSLRRDLAEDDADSDTCSMASC